MATKRLTEMEAASAPGGPELIEVAQLSSTVTITAATISSADTDNSFNDSGSGFVAAGFVVGDRVRVQGFTSSVTNLFVGIITALTTAKMTIGGTDGNDIEDEAAGNSVTISKWVSRRTTAQEIADLAGVSASLSVVSTVATADTNLLASQKGQYVRFTATGAKTYTVRPNATEALDANYEVHIRNGGASGDLTLVEDTGVTINVPNGGTLVIPVGGTATLKRAAEDEFDLMGQVVAA